jgi:hypothetical protein
VAIYISRVAIGTSSAGIGLEGMKTKKRVDVVSFYTLGYNHLGTI